MKERKKSLLKNYWELAQTSMPKTLLDSVIWIYFSKLRICDKATQILRNHPHFLRVGFSNKIWRFRQILVAFSEYMNFNEQICTWKRSSEEMLAVRVDKSTSLTQVSDAVSSIIMSEATLLRMSKPIWLRLHHSELAHKRQNLK